MTSMQLFNHEKVNSKKLQSVEAQPRTGLLIKYLDNIKSMNTLTAVQYNQVAGFIPRLFTYYLYTLCYSIIDTKIIFE